MIKKKEIQFKSAVFPMLNWTETIEPLKQLKQLMTPGETCAGVLSLVDD